MFCSECGKQLPDTSKFCTGCGAKGEIIQPSEHHQVQKVESVSNKKIMLIVAVCFVCIVVGIYLLSSKKSIKQQLEPPDKSMVTTRVIDEEHSEAFKGLLKSP